jgi:Lon protease-like protein
MEEKIGLFPLNMVVFPDSVVPLHIFEPRYRELVNGCIKESKAFGINLVENTKIHPAGCTVTVDEVIRRYPDGRIDIHVRGEKRYVLKQLLEDEESYYTGTVEYFDDQSEELDTDLLRDCVNLHNQIIDSVYNNPEFELSFEDCINGIGSFKLAQKSGLELEQRQTLLEIYSENKRLQLMREYLQEIIPRVKEKRKMQALIMNDGYIPQPRF